MEPDTRYTLIGAVVLALTAAVVFGYLWLGSSGRDADFRFYTVYFENQSLEGLQVGAPVNMRGIPVGRVESYAIEADNINRVQVVLRVTRETPVRQNTQATISRNVVTGIARVRLVTGNPPGPELVKVASGQRYPVIPEGQSGIDQFTDSATRLAGSAESALLKLNQLAGPDNQQVFAELLANLRDLAQALNARMGTLDRTASGLDRSMEVFRTSAERIADSAQRLASNTEPLSQEAVATLREAQTALRDLARATTALEKDATRSLQTLERDGGSLLRRGDAALDIGTLELRATAQELRSSAERIARAVDRLQDPRAALLGPGSQQLGPGESR